MTIRRCFVCLVGLDQLRTEKRHDGHRDEIRSEEGKNDGRSQRCEKKLAHTGEEGDREKDDGRCQSRGQDRQRHLLSAILCGHLRRFSQFHVTEDIFEDDNRVIDQSGEGQC